MMGGGDDMPPYRRAAFTPLRTSPAAESARPAGRARGNNCNGCTKQGTGCKRKGQHVGFDRLQYCFDHLPCCAETGDGNPCPIKGVKKVNAEGFCHLHGAQGRCAAVNTPRAQAVAELESTVRSAVADFQDTNRVRAADKVCVENLLDGVFRLLKL